MEESISENKYGIQSGLLFAAMTAGAFGCGLLQGKAVDEVLPQCFQAVLLAGILICYLQLKKEMIFNCMENKTVLTVCLLLSAVLAVLPGLPVEVPVYLAGGILLATVSDMGTGILTTAVLAVLHFCIVTPEGVQLPFLLMESMAFSILATWLKKKSSILWVIACAEVVTAVLTLFEHDFLLDSACREALIWQLSGTLLLFGIVLMCSHFCVMAEPIEASAEETEKDVPKAAEAVEPKQEQNASIEAAMQEAAVASEVPENESRGKEAPEKTVAETVIPVAAAELETEKEVVSYESPLLERLQNELPRVYRHSLKVARLSALAAASIGADRALCEAAGWYHEVGRLEDKKEYITAGIKLLTEANLPTRLHEVVKQTSGKIENPQSPEAAIVMLSESILSTIQFLKMKQETVAMDKIVENNFQVRLMKGSLDAAGLSLKEYTTLKRFYLLEMAMEENA